MMKRYLKEIRNLPRFHISLYVIIPFIIMGFTVLAALVAFNLTQYHFGSKAGTLQPGFLGNRADRHSGLCGRGSAGAVDPETGGAFC